MFVFAVINDPKYPNKLTQKNYDEITKRSYPYIQKYNGEYASYAICPACMNPVRLVNKNSNERVSGTLYAMHVKYSVNDLAGYEQSNYDNCDLRNPARMDEKVRRPPSQAGISDEIKDKIRNHFDLLVQIMKKITSINFTDVILAKMLDDFVLNKGHTYRAITPLNIPYGFLYMTEAQDLYGCKVSNKMAEEINQKSEQFMCGNFNTVGRRRNTKGRKIIFFFSEHKISSVDKSQTIQLNIAELGYSDNPEDGKILYNEIIKIDNTIFDNYIRNKNNMLSLAQSKL
ncbi:hypothetical protein [Escherichia albertii]|uniref:hypothetical protein n=1 Tax=Escherichia albertii TaxID=208962 RepID=UPI0023629AC1|nr:hypothetical protein [Escherichia albertii]WDB32540.1 hypothetical protein PS032_15285 [Escherichia albertii]